MESFQLDDNESVTLEQAQQEIARLQEFQEATYYFLQVFCNYDLKAPLTKILGYSDLMLAEPLTKEQAGYLVAIQESSQEIASVANTVLAATLAEHEPSTLRQHPAARLDLRPLLTDAVRQAQERAKYISELLADLQGHRAKTDSVANAQSLEPTDIKVHIPTDLPTVWSEPDTLAATLRNVVRFITGHQSMTELVFSASFDAVHVTLIIRCSALDARERVLEDFHQFETTQTFLTLGIQSLLLYNSWRALKTYGGQIHLDIQSPETYGPSKTLVTITLPRFAG